MAAAVIGPVQTETACTFYGAVGGNAMHNTVGTAADPCAVLDDTIGRFNIVTEGEEKGADDPILMETDITGSVGDILPNQRFRRPVGGTPLSGISVVSHKCSGMCIEFHDAGKIRGG